MQEAILVSVYTQDDSDAIAGDGAQIRVQAGGHSGLRDTILEQCAKDTVGIATSRARLYSAPSRERLVSHDRPPPLRAAG